MAAKATDPRLTMVKGTKKILADHLSIFVLFLSNDPNPSVRTKAHKAENATALPIIQAKSISNGKMNMPAKPTMKARRKNGLKRIIKFTYSPNFHLGGKLGISGFFC